MKKYYFAKISDAKKKELIKRKAISSDSVKKIVEKICNDVKKNGLTSAIKYAKKFDGLSSGDIYVTEKEFSEAEKFWEIVDDLKSAGASGILLLPIENIVL